MVQSSANPTPRVLVLYGGQSSEHSVSCVTAAGVLNALGETGYDVVEIGVTPQGQWTRPVVDPRGYSFSSSTLPVVEPTESSVHLFTGPSGSTTAGAHLLEVHPDGSTSSMGEVDVVLPLLHGPFGEDGTIQGLLELAGVPYVGAGVLTSAVGMDKHFMKIAFEAAGLTVGPWETITARQWERDAQACLDRAQRLTLPVFVKPARAGSSVGISRVDRWEDFAEAVTGAQKHDPKIVVEQGIDGREIECGVLGGADGPRASLLGEIVVESGDTAHSFYDFQAKYTDSGAAVLSCPAELPDEVSEQIRAQALVAFEAIDGEGISRMDFFYTTDGEVLINEVNTMPGFTPASMYPQVWKASGIDFSDLITELLELALQRPIGLR